MADRKTIFRHIETSVDVDITIEEYEYKLAELRDECIDYKKQGHCEWTDCRECHYQNICDEWESEY